MNSTLYNSFQSKTVKKQPNVTVPLQFCQRANNTARAEQSGAEQSGAVEQSGRCGVAEGVDSTRAYPMRISFLRHVL